MLTVVIDGRTWTAVDACGNSASAEQRITLQDTTAPAVAGYATCLWPPNKKFICLTDTQLVAATDNCGAVSRTYVDCSVTERDRSSGVVRNVAGSSALCVRTGGRVCIQSDRNGGSVSRYAAHFVSRRVALVLMLFVAHSVYAIQYDVTDACGNVASATQTVTVPHDQATVTGCLAPVSKTAARRLLSESEDEYVVLEADAFTAMPAWTPARLAVVAGSVAALAMALAAVAVVMSRLRSKNANISV